MKFERNVLHRDLYFYLLIGIIASLPFSMFFNVQWNSIFVILLLLNWLLEGDFRKKLDTLLHKKIIWVFISLYLVNLISILYSENKINTTHELTVKLPLLIFPIILASSSLLTKSRLNVLLMVFIVSIVIASLFTFRKGLNVVSFENFEKLNLLILHRPYFGMYILLALYTIVYVFKIEGQVLKRLFILFVLSYLLFFLYFIKTKMAYINILGTILLIVTIILVKKKQIWGILLLYTVISISVIYLYQSNSKIQKLSQKIIAGKLVSFDEYGSNIANSVNLRLISWFCSVDIMQSDSFNWWIGVGAGDVVDSLVDCYEDKNEFLFKNKLNAHSQYLDQLLGSGIIGMIILLLNIAIPFTISIRKNSYLYTYFILIFAITCFTEVVLSRQAGVVFYALFNSLFCFHLVQDNIK